MSRYSRWGWYTPAPSAWERREKAAKTIARLTKKGEVLSPVEIEGRTIARTFWGKAWCDNIESYRDFAYRLERGRSYVRSGAVIDLQISEGRVSALVIGSGTRPYRISIDIDRMAKARWDALVQRSAGKISSLMALAQGKLPEEMLKDFCDPETGLFPKPREIHFSCTCPDGASCCKHVAAVLYGIGARLDKEPTLFFTLRGIDPESIVTAEVVDTLTEGAESELDAADIGDVFGISLDTGAEIAPDADAGPNARPAKKGRQAKAPVKGSRSRATEVKTKPKGSRTRAAAAPSSPSSATPPAADFPARIRAYRARTGLSQGALGKLLGTHQVGVSLLERGRTAPRPEILAAFEKLERSET